MELYIDADNQIAGRLASKVAKELLKGGYVYVVNAERAVISGNPAHVAEIYKGKRARGDPYHGPFYPRTPDRMLKRIVRNMLPYKKERGRVAFKRLKIFISVPENLKDKNFTRFKEAENRLQFKSMKLGDLSRQLGWK